MQENIPLAIERLSDKHEKECRITSPLQTQSLLRDIAEEASSAALHYDGSRNFIITTLLDVGGKGLWVEQGADMGDNHRIADSQKITLASSHHHVNIRLVTRSVRLVTHQSYPAFYLPFPERPYRIFLQRYATKVQRLKNEMESGLSMIFKSFQLSRPEIFKSFSARQL